jgi:hypothetical protein
MKDERESAFRKVERFLLDLALLLLLLGGLCRVLAPEMREVIKGLTSDDRPAAVESQTTEPGAGATKHGSLYEGH